MISRVFLSPGRLLTDAVVDWLCGDKEHSGLVRMTAEGALSLDHVMIVVPTAQSGRSLRLKLARHFEKVGILPPRVVQPMALVRPAEEPFREATDAEVDAAFQKFVGTLRADVLGGAGSARRLTHLFTADSFDDLTARFALLDQLKDIWRILAGGGLLMRDVLTRAPETFARAIGDEAARWEELAELESRFFAFLHERGLCHPAENVSRARTNPRPLDPAVERLVLPAMADPIRVFESVLEKLALTTDISVLLHAEPADAGKFGTFGRPLTEAWTGRSAPKLVRLTNQAIVRTPDTTSLAVRVAADFPVRKPNGKQPPLAAPSLALCDESLYTEVAAAFLNRGCEVHNPEMHRLTQSSLGRILDGLMSVFSVPEQKMPWDAFAALMRDDDVLSALDLDESARYKVLSGIDVAWKTFLPRVLPVRVAFPPAEFRKPDGEHFAAFQAAARTFLSLVDEARRGQTIGAFLRTMLVRLFEKRTFGSAREDREFAMAVQSASEFLGNMDSDFVVHLGLSASEQLAFARRLLREASYTLEPDSPDALKTEGWLELAWSAAKNVALVGLHELCVPDAVVGHPFLPDSLRGELGLVTNEDRLARDTWLLSELLASHGEGAVRIYVARTNATGDICRPSRLLYLTDDLPARAQYLFDGVAEESHRRVRDVNPKWLPRLPDPDSLPPVEHYSASALDTYIKCPLTYLLQNVLKMESVKTKQELDAADFGQLVHQALETYAHVQMARGDNQLTNAADIRDCLAHEVFPVLRQRYGQSPSLQIQLQLDALEGRLDIFADFQSEWAQQGWRVVGAEVSVNGLRPLAEYGMPLPIHGSIDRVDRNLTTGALRVIDYKTWDAIKKASGHVFASVSPDGEQALFAEELGYPLALVQIARRNKPAQKRFLSVQLPIYAACLKGLPAFRDAALRQSPEMMYLVLGNNAEVSGVFSTGLAENADVALETACRALELIRAGIYWPSGPSDEWAWNYKGLFVFDPRQDLKGSAWVRQQVARLADFKAREARHD